MTASAPRRAPPCGSAEAGVTEAATGVLYDSKWGAKRSTWQIFTPQAHFLVYINIQAQSLNSISWTGERRSKSDGLCLQKISSWSKYFVVHIEKGYFSPKTDSKTYNSWSESITTGASQIVWQLTRSIWPVFFWRTSAVSRTENWDSWKLCQWDNFGAENYSSSDLKTSHWLSLWRLVCLATSNHHYCLGTASQVTPHWGHQHANTSYSTVGFKLATDSIRTKLCSKIKFIR